MARLFSCWAALRAVRGRTMTARVLSAVFAAADGDRFDDREDGHAGLQPHAIERAAGDPGDETRVAQRELHVGMRARFFDGGDSRRQYVVRAHAFWPRERQHAVRRIAPYTDGIADGPVDARDDTPFAREDEFGQAV